MTDKFFKMTLDMFGYYLPSDHHDYVVAVHDWYYDGEIQTLTISEYKRKVMRFIGAM